MPEAALIVHHVDDHCLVVVKPSGLPSVPGRAEHLHDCLWHRVQAHWPDALVVHRLDMATSGLMLFARGLAAQRTLSAAFAERRVDKGYLAIVAGVMADDHVRIDLPLIADWPNRPKQKVDAELGKPSSTLCSVLARDTARATTRLKLEPLTGRSHQLRVHLMALGHPILGDTLYAPPEIQARSPRLLLHAQSLGFAHPASGARIELVDTAPF